MFHLDRPMYLLGYLANQSRVYLIDKEFKYVTLKVLEAAAVLIIISSLRKWRFWFSLISKLNACEFHSPSSF